MAFSVREGCICLPKRCTRVIVSMTPMPIFKISPYYEYFAIIFSRSYFNLRQRLTRYVQDQNLQVPKTFSVCGNIELHLINGINVILSRCMCMHWFALQAGYINTRMEKRKLQGTISLIGKSLINHLYSIRRAVFPATLL